MTLETTRYDTADYLDSDAAIVAYSEAIDFTTVPAAWKHA